MLSHFIVTLMLKLIIFGLAGRIIHADPINPQTECRGTEVCPLSSDTELFDIDCNCGDSNAQCYWAAFTNPRKALTDGSLLSWHRNTTGYGQYTCIDLNGTTVRNVLILPAADAQDLNCSGCINTTICRTPTGTYFVRFVKLFIDDESDSPCELYLNGRLVLGVPLVEGRHIEMLPNCSYSIRCYICEDIYEIRYTIPIPNDTENCSNLSTYTQVSTTVSAMSTISPSAVIPSFEPQVSIGVKSMMTMVSTISGFTAVSSSTFEPPILDATSLPMTTIIPDAASSNFRSLISNATAVLMTMSTIPAIASFQPPVSLTTTPMIMMTTTPDTPLHKATSSSFEPTKSKTTVSEMTVSTIIPGASNSDNGSIDIGIIAGVTVTIVVGLVIVVIIIIFCAWSYCNRNQRGRQNDPLQIMNMRTIRPDKITQGDLNLVSNTERIKSSQESPCKEQNDPLYEKVSPYIKQVVIVDSASDEIKRNCNLSEPQLTNDNDTKIALDPAYQKLTQYQGSTVICNRHNENGSEI